MTSLAEPIRMCLACRRRAPQGALLRLAADADGVIQVASRPRRGRGAYVCPELACLKKAVQKGALGRALDASAPLPPPLELVRRARVSLQHRMDRLRADPGAVAAREPLAALLAALDRIPGPPGPKHPGARPPRGAHPNGGSLSHQAQTERRKGGPASAHG